MASALVLIDIQNDYFSGGAMELKGMEQAADNASKILAHFRDNELPVFHIQHLSTRPGATFFLPDTEGCKIHKSVEPISNEPVIQKNYPSSFQNTTLAEELEKAGVDELVICGAMSHMCIDTTVRAAFERNFKSTVISDACATCDLEFGGRAISAADVHASYMAAIGMVFANVTAAASFLK